MSKKTVDYAVFIQPAVRICSGGAQLKRKSEDPKERIVTSNTRISNTKAFRATLWKNMLLGITILAATLFPVLSSMVRTLKAKSLSTRLFLRWSLLLQKLKYTSLIQVSVAQRIKTWNVINPTSSRH